MKAFLKNVISLFSKDKKADTVIEKRETENALLRAEKKSDVNRWQHNKELYRDWDERTIILGSYILPNASIIEFGAGNMILKTYLQDYKIYTPSDVIPRFEETLVCDLNQPITFEFAKYDTAVFSGVLEYVYDIDKVFLQLGETVKQVVLSYCCADIVKLSRDKNGWLSDYTKDDLENIFTKHGFKIQDYTEWRQQSIYNLTR